MKLNSSNHSLALTFPLRQRGFTLIELMIATTLGLLLLASLVYVYTNSAQSFRAQSALTLIQNNARYAFEIMGVDIRMAGFTGSQGTKSKLPDSIVSTTSDRCPLVDLFGDKGCTGGAGPLLGYENSSPAYASARAGTDSLTVVRVDTADKYAVSAYTAPTFTLTQWHWSTSSDPEEPPKSEIFVAGDYTHTAIFQVASKNPGAKTVSHAGSLGTFGGGANALSLYNLSGVTYYIGTNPAGEPALYRDKLGHSGTTVNSTAEELIEGVENMQILYGVDTNANGNVDAYQNAGLVATWGNVLSVRITLTLVSQQGVKIRTTGDHLLRKTFTNTIAIRNRLL